MTETTRGALLMTLAMAMFAVEDAIIKGLTDRFSPAQIIWMLGLGGAVAFGVQMRLSGLPLWILGPAPKQVLLRTGCEAIGAIFFVSALAAVPLALASAVIQATPLVVALGAVVFLGAQIGWRRWAAILFGFLGVLIILRPGTDAFSATTLLAVGGMLGLAARDVATRTIPADVSGVRLSFLAFLALVPTGLVLQLAQGIPPVLPTAVETGILALCVGIGMVAYLAIVAGTRIGDLAVVTSFRYTRMVFALLLSFTFFNETPDGWTLIGVVIVIGSGVFMLRREARLRVSK
ncbi:membrane protein [Jannaschia pagri]|uniref:Membrane protein n=1 Tax=Jannaschia pagri TaxID=2829797 RepID=A0ABQ4NNP8_9RHOB|nr:MULTISPECIES: DMT family transporter [unclassified Jannaschia]GIT92190.1 membrane protein [Jannaschia sp. AI_61]GIT96025.1 membrane protein [Jannaschia sp. AI_62]